MQRLSNPFPIWLDLRGALLDAGNIYIGTAAADPEVSPINVYWDEAQTQLAEQPLKTLSGVIVNGASPGQVYISAADYSIRVRDADDNQISYMPSAILAAGVSYQPLNGDLTAIATLPTTEFGRNLLILANAAALKAAAGVVDGLPLTGGTVSGNIVRSGSGSHLYHNDAAMAAGRIFVTANGAADPTSLVGDIWLELQP